MRLLPLLLFPLLSLLPFTSSAASSSPKQTKLQRLSVLAASTSGPIVLTDKTYDDLTSGPRNYTALVLLTALAPRFGCHMCQEFHPEYELVARTWLRKHKDGDGLFFSYLDFTTGMGTFKKLGLQSAPVLYLFPPTYGPNAKPGAKTDPISFEFQAVPDLAAALSKFISRNSPYQISVTRPFDYSKILFTSFGALVLLTLLKVLLPRLLPVLTHPTFWAAFSLISILLFTSGHMFNHIRKTPYMAHQAGGRVSYIAAGFSNQFAVESQIVGCVYAFLAFGTIALAMKVPRQKEERRQGLAVVVWSAVILCLFSFLMGLFKVKNQGYPFWLPPLMGKI